MLLLAFLAEMTLFGSWIAFWAVFAVWALFLFAAIEWEWPGRATIACVVFLVAFQFFGGLPGGGNLLAWLAAHLMEVAIGLAGFFVVGTGWAICKWWFHVTKAAERYVELRVKFLEKHKVKNVTDATPVPEELKDEWFTEGKDHSDRHRYRFVNIRNPRLNAKDNKARIITWMCYWPFSMVWTIINDPIKRAFRAIFRAIQGHLQTISDRIFAKVGAIEDEERDGAREARIRDKKRKEQEERDKAIRGNGGGAY